MGQKKHKIRLRPFVGAGNKKAERSSAPKDRGASLKEPSISNLG